MARLKHLIQSLSAGLLTAGLLVVTVGPAHARVKPKDGVQAVRELRFDPQAAVEGTTVTGTVVLTSPAPAGGVSVEVWSNTSYGPNVSVPRWVTVAAGRTTATFPATVYSASTPSVVRPSAYLGASRATGKLIVVPPTFATGPTWVRHGAVTEAAVGIGTAPNSDGVTVTLSTGTPGVSVPATVFISPGSRGAVFPVTVDGSASLSNPGAITATWNGIEVRTTFYIGY
ncbi:hypothetical protein OG470_20235 [Micromonospora sp. NBC_00389]|uniref:hypothetical protein n=1 Tax=Micromonospora sp. NBC_00389 TaxID=2903586 RepID=UPI002E23D377